MAKDGALFHWRFHERIPALASASTDVSSTLAATEPINEAEESNESEEDADFLAPKHFKKLDEITAPTDSPHAHHSCIFASSLTSLYVLEYSARKAFST